MRFSAASACALVALAVPARAGEPIATRKRPEAAAPVAARTSGLPAFLLAPDPSARDIAVGEACRRGLGGNQGAVVAMDPKTGRVIALVNPFHGLINAYQPCSVFKIVTAIAGLSEGVI